MPESLGFQGFLRCSVRIILYVSTEKRNASWQPAPENCAAILPLPACRGYLTARTVWVAPQEAKIRQWEKPARVSTRISCSTVRGVS